MAESQQRLQPCPSSPNCVCSDATDSHGIEPLAIAGDPQLMWRRLQDYLAQQRGFTIKQVDDLYLRVGAKTRLLRFVEGVGGASGLKAFTGAGMSTSAPVVFSSVDSLFPGCMMMVGGGPLVDGFSAMNGILVIPKFRIFSFFPAGPIPPDSVFTCNRV